MYQAVKPSKLQAAPYLFWFCDQCKIHSWMILSRNHVISWFLDFLSLGSMPPIGTKRWNSDLPEWTWMLSLEQPFAFLIPAFLILWLIKSTFLYIIYPLCQMSRKGLKKQNWRNWNEEKRKIHTYLKRKKNMSWQKMGPFDNPQREAVSLSC